MKKMGLFITSLLCVFTVQASITDYLSENDKRAASFEAAKKLIKERQLYTWIETGTARYGARECIGDGCSTMIYSDFLNEINGELFSVDINPNAIQEAEKAVYFNREKIHFVVSDSINFLENFDHSIDFLYLDSYDFELNNPLPSQIHHLKEIIAAYNKLTDQSVVMIDDCQLPHGGKGKLIIDFLVKRGWKKVFDGYQVIMVKDV
jgi:SAM-dependent methyltransferase